MSGTSDAYARLPFRSDRARRANATGGGLTFFDLADRSVRVEAVTGHLREVPLDLVGRQRWVLVRWGSPEQGWSPAGEAADALQERLRVIGSEAQVGVAVFEVGSEPTVAWSADAAGSRGHEHVLLARARSVELHAFLDWGNALWMPSGYHYRLPSGRHSGSFVRIADAFQDQRASGALSTWLYGGIDDNAPTTVIMDVGTLMPLVAELQAAADRHRDKNSRSSARVGSVRALDRYPSSALGLQRNLLHLSPDSPVLGLVSVSASGEFAGRLLSACAAMRAPHVRIEQIVSRWLPGATRLPGADQVVDSEEASQFGGLESQIGEGIGRQRWAVEDPWLSLEESDEQGTDGDCVLCRDQFRARLVRINPRAMSAMVLPEPELVVPDIFDARRNASIWERYGSLQDATGVISLLGPTGTRISSPMERVVDEAVFFEPTRLLADNPSELIGNRLADFLEFPRRNGRDQSRERVQRALELVSVGASVVIYEKQERDLFADDEWQRLCDALVEHGFVAEESNWCGFATDGGLDSSAHPEGADASSVLVLALGSRTGLSCQRMFLAGRQRWPGASFGGLVIHAHPEDGRIWASIRNTFTDSNGGKRLLALWLTHLPGWSPLAMERDTYRAAQHRGLDSGELSRRLEELTAMEASDQEVLPGRTLLGRVGPSLRPHSYLGEELGSRETLCAVGASMQAARLRARTEGAPSWVQFDLRRILRSYFDGLIHACVLRWCESHEAWWGPRQNDCPDFLQELEGLDFDFNLLLPELLLACAQEKLPREVAGQLIEAAKLRLRETGNGIDQRTLDHLRLGVDLCELALNERLSSPPSPASN